jgi:hypothetical protein
MFLRHDLKERALEVTRRRVLQGLLGGAMVSVGLPILECMLDDSGEAFAGGGELPTRFGMWYFGNGVRLSSWTPVTTGYDWQLGPDAELAPLLAHKEYVSVVSGLEVKTPYYPHHSGWPAVCSAGPHLRMPDVAGLYVSTFQYPSIDRLAADHFMQASPTPFRSLELAVTRFTGSIEGTTFQHLSHNGPNSVNPSESSPHAVWNRLFGTTGAEPMLKQARASVLDAVAQQIKALEPKLGAVDRQRLDQHFESVRDLEQRLLAPVGECTTPTDPGDFPDVGGNEQIAEKNRAMSDLLALALSCGLTQTFSIMFSTCGNGTVFWMAGATDSQHYTNHTEAAPYTIHHNATIFTMEQLAYFLERLQSTPEGAGNLLDRCSIVVATEHTEGWTHSQQDMPMLICGKGGGRLRGNFHYRQVGGNTTRTLLTALRGAGLPLEGVGYEGGYSNEPIAELEV